ncbi:DUF3558 domain-containing protein [Nocardia nova]|uniref:DUF3558 domain-containing protein n=1 Tax=Nocardia nova SH22a TaxID=1415166 RepID=W5TWT7_9NOCA|nr:DUF3558 domain-containing protein [Nocardia nova]AHH21661.1 hypothetical protein NONO_c68940 [Nocardia nova SH22a]
MRLTAVIVTGAAVAALLAGCGSGDGADDESPSVRPPAKVAALGPFVGECGNLTDDEVRDLGGLGQVSQVFKNSVGCTWQAGGIGGPSVTFASYRGSPIDRELAWVTSQGRNPEKIEIDGKKGFQDADQNFGICDLAIQLGDDFFEWSTAAGAFGAMPGSPCDKNRKLAELTVQRLK